MIYCFGNIRVNTKSNRLSINGAAVNVDERIYGLLVALINCYPNHCSKAHLLEILWPDTVVSDWSISKLVSETRQTFKLNGVDQEIIQTLHGRGYRLATGFGDQLRTIEDDNKNIPTVSSKQNFLFKKPYLISLVIGLFAILFVYLIKNQESSPLQKSEPAKSIGRLLWVDDHPDNNLTEKAYLEGYDITVYQVTSSEDALTSLALYQYDVVVSDMGRNGEVLAGLNLLKAMRENNDKTPFLLYTIVLSQAQQQVLQKYQGQGVAVEPEKLYEMILPYFSEPKSKERKSAK